MWIAVLLWYLLASLVGWLTFPIAYRFLPALADRGYLFSRGLGLLLWGYCFWLLVSLGVLRNDLGGLTFSLLILLGASLWSLRSIGGREIFAWLRSRLRLVIVGEGLFLLAFAGWTVVRGANPEALGTEKPMELAFINAILHSPTFPPHDPWLSGYAISYYYFGYVLVAMLAGLSGVTAGVAFNLGISLVFSLSALGSFGVVYDLLAARQKSGGTHAVDTDIASRYALPALLGPFFVLIVSNLEGFLELLHARGLFWRFSSTGEWISGFWKWLDLQELSQPPAQPFSWTPTRYLWWWRASRVVQDYDFAGNFKEVIDEFPFFSYLLADLHPHVLAMPFAFLAMALALNLYLEGARGGQIRLRLRISLRGLAWLVVVLIVGGAASLWVGVSLLNMRLGVLGVAGMLVGGFAFIGLAPDFNNYGVRLLIRRDSAVKEVGPSFSFGLPWLLFAALVFGGLAFLNTWDFPFFVALLAGVYALRNLQLVGEMRSKFTAVGDFIWLGVVVGLAGVILYLPFYLGFSSQAGGILPNLVYPTRGAHLWVMYAQLFIPLSAYLAWMWKIDGQAVWIKKGFGLAFGLVFLAWILALLLGAGIAALPSAGELFLGSLSAPGLGLLLLESVRRRLVNAGGWITLILLLGPTLGLLLRPAKKEERDDGLAAPSMDAAHRFALCLLLLGLLLVLGPEFFFLRDQFGWRINTIFKFYYQAWLLWGVVAAFATLVLLEQLRPTWKLAFQLTLLGVLAVSLIYPLLGLWDKTNGFRPEGGWTLDSTAYLERQSPAEMAAIRWLRSAPPGVVAEAVSYTGGSYTGYARVAVLSGLPTVLGWIGHESQWRGGGQEMGSRQADIERLYCSRDWDDTRAILEKYQIKYVFVGSLERNTYLPGQAGCSAGLNEAKFMRFLEPAFQQGDVTIYLGVQ